MHPVLRRLGLGNPGEPDIRTAPAGGLDECLVSSRVFIHIRAEDDCPEPGQRERIGSVE